MLSKLIKHEFRATGRVMGVFYIVLFASALFTMLTAWLVRGRDILLLNLFNGLITGVFVMLLLAVPVVAVVLMINRFHRNLMTDQGYLMFTLPANEHQLILSKLIVSMVWFIASIVADVLAGLLGFLDLSDYADFWSWLIQQLSHLRISVNDFTGYGIELLLIILFGSVAACLMVYGAISLGYSFANKKGLLSVVFFCAFYIALQMLIVAAIGLVGRAAPLDQLSGAATMHVMLCGVLAFILLVGAGFYLLTYEMLHRRLNLQ
jgi:hypothetical protein